MRRRLPILPRFVKPGVAAAPFCRPVSANRESAVVQLDRFGNDLLDEISRRQQTR